jgi:CheY-like chemotaxis protein
MDVQMPVMNGYEATKLIRKLENRELANIPILAMTANAFEEDKQEALRAGMNGHVAKPINIEKLLETVEEILK